jgi:carbon storage regulator CsrA
MLSLSRIPGEQIIIGDAVVTVSRVRGNRVSIGIVAPKSVRIIRGEIAEEGNKFRRDSTPLQTIAEAERLLANGKSGEALKALRSFMDQGK